MVCVIGLGNPGSRYAQTRHNIGFMILDSIARRLRATFRVSNTRSYLSAEVKIRDCKAILLKPLTYMNLSGHAALQAMTEFDVRPEELLIVYDDFQLAFGRTRVRAKGSDGGHNGMASIIDQTGTPKIPRLKIGIGHDPMPENIVEFVLSEFDEEEKKALPGLIETARDAVFTYAADGVTKTMNLFNR